MPDSEAAVEDEETESLFEQYRPRHWRHGADHPDPVVETTSLAFTTPPQMPEDQATLVPGLLASAVPQKTLSSLQLEAVAYAGMRHEQTLADGVSVAGFFLGDGPGVGKGRQLAAIIVENWLKGRQRHLWLSVSPDLEHDARRDLEDLTRHMGAAAPSIPVYNLSKLSYRDIRHQRGVIFATYSALVSKEGATAAERDVRQAEDEGDAAALQKAQAAMAGNVPKRTRLQQLVQWMRGADPTSAASAPGKLAGSAAAGAAGASKRLGCVMLDECHKAKNLIPSAASGGGASLTAQAVVELQRELPAARVVYCSATGASSVKNMAYMERLGLWGPGTAFPAFKDFDVAIDRAGVGAMELVALDMKQRGMYLCRALSYKDATFETIEIELSAEQRRQYDQCAQFWQAMQECFEHALDTIASAPGWKAPVNGMAQFWGAHQRFFKQLLMSMKVPTVVSLAHEARQAGKCVVIGLQTTGEARMAEALKDAGEDGVEDFRGLQAIVENLLETQFPTMGERDDEDAGGADAGGGGGGGGAAAAAAAAAAALLPVRALRRRPVVRRPPVGWAATRSASGLRRRTGRTSRTTMNSTSRRPRRSARRSRTRRACSAASRRSCCS